MQFTLSDRLNASEYISYILNKNENTSTITRYPSNRVNPLPVLVFENSYY